MSVCRCYRRWAAVCGANKLILTGHFVASRNTRYKKITQSSTSQLQLGSRDMQTKSSTRSSISRKQNKKKLNFSRPI